MSKNKTNSEYGKVARLAYENGIDLYDEARLLLKQNSPRAFALAVASIEELEKAFLCDTVWKQDLDADVLVAELGRKKWPMLTSHGSKQRLFGVSLLMSEARKGGRKALEETAATLERTLTTASLTLKEKAGIEELIFRMESRRQDSLYVGVKPEGGRIKTPKTVISTQMSKDLLEKIE